MAKQLFCVTLKQRECSEIAPEVMVVYIMQDWSPDLLGFCDRFVDNCRSESM
jgi:hypothetical protein